MYSQSVFESINLVEEIFLAGMIDIKVKEKVKPQILLSFMNSTSSLITENSLDFVFPLGMEAAFSPEPPRIYSIVLTNEKAVRSYIYVLYFYDAVKIDSVIKYVPIGICISSFISNISFFRGVLNEFYKIINLKKLNEDPLTISNYQKLELLNYFNLLKEITLPPPCSIMTLNLRFTSVPFFSPSKFDFLRNDDCINVLFNSLEISSIIKIYLAMLFEKHVIILAKQNTLLFSICEALVTLLFPFKWLHSFIPILPPHLSDYLESPTPYLMGVITTKDFTLDTLSKTYPNHIICDSETSTVYGSLNGQLPPQEEQRIKTELLNIQFPQKSNLDSLLQNTHDSYHDKALKIQNVFFSIFKDKLTKIKENYIYNNVFNSTKFLDSCKTPESKEFFEKLINTLGFEFFILSMQYLDDSLSRRFNLIISSKAYQKNYYNYSFDIPKTIGSDTSNELVESYNKIVALLVSPKEEKENPNEKDVHHLNFYSEKGFDFFEVPSFSFEKEITKTISRLFITVNQNASTPTDDDSSLVKIPADSSAQFYNIIAAYCFKLCLGDFKDIVSLYSKSYKTNRFEFPRNLYYMILSTFSHTELKTLSAIYKNKFISKAILYLLRKIEKVKYKTLVLSHESDESDTEEEPSTPKIRRGLTTTSISSITTKRTQFRRPTKYQLIDHAASYQIEKDPIALIEKICVKLFNTFMSYNLFDDFDSSKLREITKNENFTEVKNLILSLQKISLLKISQSPTNYFCFWLNLYNFLTLFAIIYKSEINTNYYEWYRFLKNSYYNVGNCEISLYEIENVILRRSEVSKRIYGENIKCEVQNLPLLECSIKYLEFGISIPNVSSPKLKIYFPFNFEESLKANAIEFLNRTISLDINNLTIRIPEYLQMLEGNFLENIHKFKDILPGEIIEFLKETQGLEEKIEKYDWKMSFKMFKGEYK